MLKGGAGCTSFWAVRRPDSQYGCWRGIVVNTGSFPTWHPLPDCREAEPRVSIRPNTDGGWKPDDNAETLD